MKLTDLIEQVETHTKEVFDIKNRRHYSLLNGKIERQNQDELRRLRLMGKALHSIDGENEIYNDKTHFLQKRHK